MIFQVVSNVWRCLEPQHIAAAVVTQLSAELEL